MPVAVLAAASLFAPLPEIHRAPQVTYLDRSGRYLGVRGGAAPPVDLARLPAYVPAAFVSIEDRRFYEHAGFDAVGMARAIVSDLAKGRAAQGASTITQQLARNLFLSQDQTVERKTQELVYAVELEQKFSKQQILSLYLSRVYFGSGAYGIEAASRRFFDKPASRLTLREAAALAAVLKSPAGYSPVDNPARSAARARLVLDAMVETGAITAAERAAALARPLGVQAADPDAPARWFVDWADLQARRAVGSFNQDLVVETTLDRAMQDEAAASARAVTLHDRSDGSEEAALVAVDGAGRVRAMLGGAGAARGAFNRATEAHRPAGSSWKPFVYLAALEAGRTPDTVAVDEPVTIGGWSPRNHDNAFLGPITLTTALARSVNTVAARTADEVGRPRVAATARRLGVDTPISLEPAMALGVSEVTPIEMAGAYAAFANGGRRVQPYGVERIRAASGQMLWRRAAVAQPQAIANPPLSELNLMLRAVVTEGTGVRAAIPGYDIAGKTGTTQESRDAWFCGFTGGFAAVVWVGRDDDKPMPHLAGGGSPAAIWRGFMRAALPRAGATAIPPGPAAAVAPPPVQTPPETPPLADPNDPVSSLLDPAAPQPPPPGAPL